MSDISDKTRFSWPVLVVIAATAAGAAVGIARAQEALGTTVEHTHEIAALKTEAALSAQRQEQILTALEKLDKKLERMETRNGRP